MLQIVLKAEVQSDYLTDIADSIQCSTGNNKNIPYSRVASTYSMCIYYQTTTIKRKMYVTNDKINMNVNELDTHNSSFLNVLVLVLVSTYTQKIQGAISNQPARSPAWTSENTTRIRPAMQTTTPVIFMNLYFVFKKIHVRSMTHGMDQQSRSITLVSDVY